jgi:6-phosphofructo-2-kinase/fructose-2,6-biphosphatase 4
VHAGYKVVQKQIMAEINPGVWDGLSAAEAQELYPDEWDRFLGDPYAHRAPRAESYHDLSVRLEPVIFELERCQDDLLIIGHASVIRCLLAYLVGLPPSEVPAIEIARGDLVEVTPASYGVVSRAFHFWSGEGRGDAAGHNLYENFAEATSGVGGSIASFAGETENIEREAEAEEQKDKEKKADNVRAKLRERLGSKTDGWMSAPHGRGTGTPAEGSVGGHSEHERDVPSPEVEGEEPPTVRERASEFTRETGLTAVSILKI